MTEVNATILDQIIGMGSLQGWTRRQVMEEYSSIVKAAENGGNSLDEWDAMRNSLAILYAGTTCDKFTTLVRLFLFGRFERLFIQDL